jgi:ribosomal protein S18 acetylase RimI-like enzyme
MLEFATGEEASMDAFLSISEPSPYRDQLRDYAESLLQQRCTKPDWCVLGLEAGTPVARAALWALPGQEVPTDVVLIEADWSDSRLTAGHALLTKLHELAGALGADTLGHSVDSPPGAPQYQENEDARIRLLTGSGYELLRDGLRWRYAAPGSDEAVTEYSLAFRTLPEVGEDAFVDAIALTYQGTRDSWIGRNIVERGMSGVAREDFHDQQGMEYRPEWWELAYTADSALAGLIMAARNPGGAVISYVGVVPDQRGRGLASELVRRGTQRLRESGADEIRGDCDRDNVGMVKAFERAGYEQFARRRTYHRAISSG